MLQSTKLAQRAESFILTWILMSFMGGSGSGAVGLTYEPANPEVSVGLEGSASERRLQRLQSEAASRISACGARGGAGDRSDMGEHAAGVPGWEGSYERRGAVELDPALAGGLGPGELAGVPFDEGFGFRRDVEVFIEAVVRLADLGVSELDE